MEDSQAFPGGCRAPAWGRCWAAAGGAGSAGATSSSLLFRCAAEGALDGRTATGGKGALKQLSKEGLAQAVRRTWRKMPVVKK
mmetsp:Transcript_9366/g.15504  ORF Transcript_9366/g.15504 Transcript_9366/m.15504 type:complete len:83 (+) Transcript_9366:653-901(+)